MLPLCYMFNATSVLQALLELVEVGADFSDIAQYLTLRSMAGEHDNHNQDLRLVHHCTRCLVMH